jgi:di/tricarboxylate transporter
MTPGARQFRNQSRDMPDDGTRQLLKWGSSIVGTGLLAAVLLETVLGGFTRTGAHTNTGWFALILVLGCIPFGGMLLTLGVAKWLKNKRESSGSERGT